MAAPSRRMCSTTADLLLGRCFQPGLTISVEEQSPVPADLAEPVEDQLAARPAKKQDPPRLIGEESGALGETRSRRSRRKGTMLFRHPQRNGGACIQQGAAVRRPPGREG